MSLKWKNIIKIRLAYFKRANFINQELRTFEKRIEEGAHLKILLKSKNMKITKNLPQVHEREEVKYY